MVQRMSGAYLSATQGLRRRSATGDRDAKRRRPMTYRRSSDTAYRLRVSDASPRGENWAAYLRRMTKRPGWSVARLSRESGIHRATIFKWLAGDTGVTVDSVRRVALALQDEPGIALRAAGNAGIPVAAVEDEEMAIIDRAPVDDDLKDIMRGQLLERRERERLQRIADFQTMIDLAKRDS
jgi:transcriptional regulator with XRE-family HTH domain